MIEYCGNFLHALKEVDVDNLEEDSNEDYEDHEEYSGMFLSLDESNGSKVSKWYERYSKTPKWSFAVIKM